MPPQENPGSDDWLGNFKKEIKRKSKLFSGNVEDNYPTHSCQRYKKQKHKYTKNTSIINVNEKFFDKILAIQ
jgi:hypothetical protein